MQNVYLLSGSNEGDRLEWLRMAAEKINDTCGPITRLSAVYETEAWGLNDQPDFLNQAMCIETALTPQALLQATQIIENSLGRQRTIKWGQRTLDIDILLYGSYTITLPDLKIPHPYLQKRRFALTPLAEIAPNVMHPLLGKTVVQLLDQCGDILTVRRYAP